jgi:hypothetical protein
MQIIFKTPTGKTYQAELEDDRLTNIRECDSPDGSSGGGSSGGGSNERMPGGERMPGERMPSDRETTSEQMDSENSTGGSGGGSRSKEDRVFIEQLKAVLVNNRARKQLRNRTKGLLDPRAFVKTQVDSPSVFRQNNRKDSQRNYSVVLLVDESGSMDGDKAELAQELTQSIATNLDQVGGVEVAVLGFSGNRIVEHKRFDNTGRNTMCCISSFPHDSYHCSAGERIRNVKHSDGENADLIAMEYALDYLDKNHAPGSKQIFIMLSDGAPCTSDSYMTVINSDLRDSTFDGKFTRSIDGSTRDIHHMHRLLGLFPDITSFGLGMLQGGQQVPRHVIVNDLGQTKRVLLNFLRTVIS